MAENPGDTSGEAKRLVLKLLTIEGAQIPKMERIPTKLDVYLKQCHIVERDKKKSTSQVQSNITKVQKKRVPTDLQLGICKFMASSAKTALQKSRSLSRMEKVLGSA